MESGAELQGLIVALKHGDQTLASLNLWAMNRPIKPM